MIRSHLGRYRGPSARFREIHFHQSQIHLSVLSPNENPFPFDCGVIALILGPIHPIRVSSLSGTTWEVTGWLSMILAWKKAPSNVCPEANSLSSYPTTGRCPRIFTLSAPITPSPRPGPLFNCNFCAGIVLPVILYSSTDHPHSSGRFKQ